MHTDYLTSVSRRIAQEIGGIADTIQCPLRRFDGEHPDMALFPDRYRPLPAETKRRIYRQYRHGESVAALAQRFCQTRTGICRIINTMRAAQIMELPLDYIGNEQFACLRSAEKEGEILGPLPESDPPTKKPRVPKGVPPYLASLYEVPLLTRAQEVHLFRKMNYLKYKASTLAATRFGAAQEWIDGPDREALRRGARDQEPHYPCQPSVGGLDRQAVRGASGGLLRACQRREHVVDQGGGEVRFFTGQQVQHLRELGDHEELRRTIPAVFRHRDRFRTSHSETFSITEARADHYEQESAQILRESHVEGILNGSTSGSGRLSRDVLA